METLFPIRIRNKIINYFILNFSYNVIYIMEKEIIRYEEILKETTKKTSIYSLGIISLIFFIFFKN